MAKKKVEPNLFEGSIISFEEALEKLEENVKQLDDGKLPLKEAMGLFKESIQLSEICLTELDEAEQVLKKITVGANGALVETEWNPTGGDE